MVLTSGEKYQMRQSGSRLELLISKSLPEDSGTYSCICDDVKTSATVTITGETQGLHNNKKIQLKCWLLTLLVIIPQESQ